MPHLVIDTSGPVCAAGLYEPGRNAMGASLSELIGKGHAERLIPMIEQVFSAAGLSLSAIDRIGVTVGPGSFTGIRVGVATARGLGLALGIPVVGVSTLEVLAERHFDAGATAPVLATIDAKRDEVYCQAFTAPGVPSGEPMTCDYATAVSLARAGGFHAYGSGAGHLGLADAETVEDGWPLALVGRIASRSAPDRKAKPLYLRGAGAKPQMGFAVQHA